MTKDRLDRLTAYRIDPLLARTVRLIEENAIAQVGRKVVDTGVQLVALGNIAADAWDRVRRFESAALKENWPGFSSFLDSDHPVYAYTHPNEPRCRGHRSSGPVPADCSDAT